MFIGHPNEDTDTLNLISRRRSDGSLGSKVGQCTQKSGQDWASDTPPLVLEAETELKPPEQGLQ